MTLGVFVAGFVVLLAAFCFAVAAEIWVAPFIDPPPIDPDELYQCGWCGHIHQFGVDCKEAADERAAQGGDYQSSIDTLA